MNDPTFIIRLYHVCKGLHKDWTVLLYDRNFNLQEDYY